MIRHSKNSIKIDSHEFRTALRNLHYPPSQSHLIKKQIELIKHRFEYIRTTPLKVLTQDRGFHKTLYVQEQNELHCLLEEARNLKGVLPGIRADREQGIYECLRNIVYNPELDYSQYELAKEIVSRRTVVCHIQIAAMNIINFMMIDKGLQSVEELRLFCEEIFTYFLVERLTTAACVNNRVTQALSLYFSFMPGIVSSMMIKKLKLIHDDKIHLIETASFLNRLLTNFSIYFGQIDAFQKITEKHKVYAVTMFYKDLHEVDTSNMHFADDVMGVILKNKPALITFLQEIFSFVTPQTV